MDKEREVHEEVEGGGQEQGEEQPHEGNQSILNIWSTLTGAPF